MFRWRFRKDRKLFAMSDVARDVARGLDKTLLNLRDSTLGKTVSVSAVFLLLSFQQS